MDNNFRSLMLVSLIGTSLLGCGSDSDDSTDTSGYFQYYNASANSTLTAVLIDDYTYGTVDFADAIPRYSYTTGTMEFSLYGLDEDGTSFELYTQDVTLDGENEHLLVLYGDFHSPEVLDVSFSRTEMDELNSDEDNEYSKMQVLVANAAVEQSFDAYIALETQAIEEAVLLGTVDYGSYTTEQIFDTEDYVVYLTDVGTKDVVYTTGSMSLSANTVYKLVMRPSFGAGELGFTIDNVDSTTTPTNYTALESEAEINVFNGLENQTIDVEIVSEDESQYVHDLTSFAVSPFESIGYNDFAVKAKSAEDGTTLFDNLLMTFNQGEIKTVLVYPTSDTQASGIVIEQDLRPRPYEFRVDITNLTYFYDDLNVYFVRDNETVENAEYTLTDVDFEEQLSIDLPIEDYRISVVSESDNGTQTLVYQSDSISVEGEGNYSFVLIPDAMSPFEHSLIKL
ncbi:hypothetical protein G3R49_04245 [Shewanella sp. WXL01]|uniref:hypothetical protein n=1 Tax=Shewanella sp. WXL01 TaxID=2709721 RepID=UPI001438556D|nr:hypothetical protein [Shewanella sp. WXL01]NKF49782.1 hypothetical protein [Shewanella sp. WXL01]